VTTLATALKDEIRRLARKELKTQSGPTAQAVARHRREIAQLKRQLREQEKQIAFLVARERKRIDEPDVAKDLDSGARFSARSVRAQRKRTGLSAADYAKLVGVSALTIYNWEQEKSRPRKEQLASLVSLRGIGKREAQAKLGLLNGDAKKGSPSAGPEKR